MIENMKLALAALTTLLIGFVVMCAADADSNADTRAAWRRLCEARRARLTFLARKQSCLSIQAWYRGCVVRRQFLARRRAAVVVQSLYRGRAARRLIVELREKRQLKREREATIIRVMWWRVSKFRGTSASQQLALMHKSAACIQRAWKRQLLTRIVGERILRRRCDMWLKMKAAVSIQRCWRTYSMDKKYLGRVIRLQALYRGWAVRRKMSSNAAESLVKIKDANRRASLNPSDNLKSKFNSAISHLLAGGAYSRIVKTLLYIEKWTALVKECCTLMVNDESVPVLFELISKCGRDYEGSQVILHSIIILIILSQNPVSRAQILSFTDLNHEKLVDVVNKFQDKSGRDKRTKPVFINACKLLHTYLESPERIQNLKSSAVNVQRLKLMKADITTRYNKQKQLNQARDKKKLRYSTSFQPPPAATRRGRDLNMTYAVAPRVNSVDDVQAAYKHFIRLLKKLEL